MQIVLDRGLSLAGLRRPFTEVRPRFDLGLGVITVAGNNAAGYHTTIPISDLGYRKQNPTRARAEYSVDNGWHRFVIYDDWGKRYEVEISDDPEGRALADKQVESLKAHGLLDNTHRT